MSSYRNVYNGRTIVRRKVEMKKGRDGFLKTIAISEPVEKESAAPPQSGAAVKPETVIDKAAKLAKIRAELYRAL